MTPAYKFTGKERDAESGLDNFGKRYHGSSLGRFMTPDPIHVMKQKFTDPQQWNGWYLLGQTVTLATNGVRL